MWSKDKETGILVLCVICVSPDSFNGTGRETTISNDRQHNRYTWSSVDAKFSSIVKRLFSKTKGEKGGETVRMKLKEEDDGIGKRLLASVWPLSSVSDYTRGTYRIQVSRRNPPFTPSFLRLVAARSRHIKERRRSRSSRLPRRS